MENKEVYDIEDVPSEFNLDSMLSGIEENRPKANQKAIELADSLKTDQPHFKVELSKLALGLKVASIMTAGMVGKNLFAKVVGFKANAQTQTLRIYSADFYKFFTYDIPLYRMGENDTVCEKYFAVAYPVLNYLMMTCDGVVLIYEKGDKFYFKLEEGDIEIETMGIKEDIQVCTDKPTETHKSIDSAILRSALITLYPYACLAVNTNQRRVYIVDNAFYAQYMFSCARINSPQEIPDMDLDLKDIRILLAVLSGTKNAQLTIKSTDKRIFFEGNGFAFTISLAGEKIGKEITDGIDNLIFKPEYQSVSVQAPRFSRLVDLSRLLSYSISRMSFNFSDDNALYATMLTNRSHSTFCIGSASAEANIKPLDKPVVVQSDLLRGMLKVFRHMPEADFYVTPHGIGMKKTLMVGECGLNVESVLYTEKTVSEINEKPVSKKMIPPIDTLSVYFE